MRSSRRTFGPAVLAVLLLLLGAAPPGHPYKGRLAGFDGGGGVLEGGAYRSVAVLGSQTSGASASNAYVAEEGFLAFYGQPVLGADPGELAFGVVALGGSRVLAATVGNHGGVTLLLSDLRLAFSQGSAPFTIESPGSETLIGPGESVAVSVRFAPGETPPARDTVFANTNDPAVPVWRLPLSGSGLGSAAPTLALSADSLDFGTVPIDSLAVRTLTIENAGAANLEIGPITTGDPVFGVSTATFTVQPGGAHDLSVWFDPADPKVYRDTLFIPSNDPARPAPAAVLLVGSVPSMLAVTEPPDARLFFSAAEDGPAPSDQQVRIRNGGAETLRWLAEPPTEAWLGVEPDSGTVPPGNTTIIDVRVDHQGLTAGDYHAVVRLANRSRPLVDADTVGVSLTIEPFSVQITWTPEVVRAGGSAEMRAAASVPADSGRVFYRKCGADEFQSLAMTARDDGALSTTLAGDLFDIRGVESFVKVHAGGRTVVEPKPLIEKPMRIAVLCEKVASPELPASRHRMISVPLATEGAAARDVLEDDLGEPEPSSWRAGRWSQADGKCLEHPDDLGAAFDAGNGFWFIARERETFTASGLSVFPPPAERLFPIPLAGGEGSVWWTQIGHPYAYPVSWSDCRIRDGDRIVRTVEHAAIEGLIENIAYTSTYEGETGRYEASSILEPWHGYFVNNISGKDLELLVPPEEASPAKAAPAPAPPRRNEGEWELRLEAVAGRRSGAILLGERSGARDGWDPFDHFLPPSPDGAAPVLAVRAPQGMPAPDDLRADIREVAEGVVSWSLAVRFEGAGEVRLFAEDVETLPDRCSAFLVDGMTGAVVPLGEGADFRIVPYPGEKVREIRFAAGPAAVLSAEGYEPLLPDARFALERPYPNPARQGTTIRFAIPAAGNIRLQVFNIEGRLVRDLANGSFDAGDHIASWDGKDGRGRDVGPGIYFFRLDHRGEARTARVVVFR
ncbi:MAG: choice-of-anchor D domain-containing protein [Candidatus Eisenbacteria bacterium]